MFDEKKCHKIVNSIELDNNIRIFKSDKCNRHYILIFLEHMYDSNFLNVYFCFNTNHYVKTKKIYTIVRFKIHYDIHWYTPFLWYRGFYDTAVFILSVPMHCSATRRFFYLYIHKRNSHIYRNVWSFCPNVLKFCKYTYFYLFLRNSGHFYFTLIPCFVKCSIIKP